MLLSISTWRVEGVMRYGLLVVIVRSSWYFGSMDVDNLDDTLHLPLPIQNATMLNR